MSLLWGLAGLVAGFVLAPLALLILAPEVNGVAKFLIKTGIRSGDGWIAVQRGNSYELVEVEYDAADAKAYVAEGGDDREFFEDPKGLMQTLWKTPFGFSFEGSPAVLDSVTATVAGEYGDLVADGGPIGADERFSLDELRSKAHVGTIEKNYGEVKHRIEYINPFVNVREGVVADARKVVNLLSNAGTSETPRKTAENAAQAERAFENWGDLKRTGSMIAAFVVGGIMVYIAMSNGGGGGGGSGGVSLMVTGLGGL